MTLHVSRFGSGSLPTARDPVVLLAPSGTEASVTGYRDMARLRVFLAAAGVALAIVALPAKAYALGPFDIEVGGKAGTATGNFGPLGFGIGGRAGVSVRGFYAGIDVIDYLGATSTCGGCSMELGAGGTLMQSRHALVYGFEAGYGFKFSRVTIRPQVGLGDFRLASSAGNPPGPVSDVSNSFYLEPAVVGLVSFAMVFVGADVGCAFVLPEVGVAFTVHGQVGVTF